MPLVRRLGVLVALLAAAAALPGTAFAAPVNVTAPSLLGVAKVDWRLSADAGTWTGADTYAYQWQRCNPGCANIPGATTPTYSPVAGDVGYTLQVTVTASGGGVDVDAMSGASAAVDAETFTITTPHFVVHYQSGSGGNTQTEAGDVAAIAERAYAAELALGFPAPLSDSSLGGDARTDIYLWASGGALGTTVPDTTSSPTSSWITIDPSAGRTVQTISHELFHAIQLGIWQPGATSDFWLLEGAAEWIGHKLDGFPTIDADSLGPWDMALDCRDPLGTYQCDRHIYLANGYSRWPFFEYVTERWDAGIVKSVLQQGPGAGSAVTALSNALGAKGTSLADVFTDWVVVNMTGSYAAPSLRGLLPPAYGAPLATGTLASLNVATRPGAAFVTSGAIETRPVPVNHLSARYLALQRGSPTLPDVPCYKATLALSVALPAGIGARPYVWWSQKAADGTNKEKAQPLSINGTTASITLPWDTCDWGATRGYLVLPNPSATANAQEFRVGGTLTVDRNTEATATLPPDAVSIRGSATVDAAEDVPRIEVFGPQLIRISASSRVLRLIVSASGPGKLQASLGSASLGTVTLRAGNNDVRFALGRPTVQALKRPAAAATTLRLTPLSTAGAAGQPVVKRVQMQQPAAKTKTTAAKKTAAAKPSKPANKTRR